MSSPLLPRSPHTHLYLTRGEKGGVVSADPGRGTLASRAQAGSEIVDLLTLICESVRFSPTALSFLGAGEQKVGDWALPDAREGRSEE